MRLPQIIPRKDVLKLISACPNTFIGKRNKTAIILMYRCGLRVSEVCNLAVNDIESGMVRIRQGKGGKDRYVPLQPETESLVEKWLEVRNQKYSDSTWLLVTRDGKQTIPRTYQLMLQELSRKTGVYLRNGSEKSHVHPHILRHCFATELLEAGMNIRWIQSLLGHSHLNTTMIYTQIRMPEVAEFFKNQPPVLGGTI